MRQNSLKRLDQLDGMRFVLILTIVVYHMDFMWKEVNYPYGPFFYQYLKNATIGVDYFFMLSGFGIYYSMVARDRAIRISVKDSISFAKSKVRRIYKPYILSLLIMIPLTVASMTQNHSIKYAVLGTGAFFGLNLTLFQSATASLTFSHALNGVCWFLSTLFISYLACPLFVRLTRNASRKSGKAVIFGLVISYISAMLMSALGVYLDDRFAAVGHGLLNDFYYGSPYVRCTYLLIGMMVCAAYLWLKDEADDRIKISFETAVCILSVIYFFSRRSILDAFNENLVAIRALDLLNSMTVLQALAFGNGGGGEACITPQNCNSWKERHVYLPVPLSCVPVCYGNF